MIDIELKKRGVYLGKTGETGRYRVWMDVSEWAEEYEGGTGLLLYTGPKGNTAPMRTLVEFDGEKTKLVGLVTSEETREAGMGVIEARWESAGVVAKSDHFNTVVMESSYTGNNVGDNTPDWVRDLMTELNAAGVLLEQAAEISGEVEEIRETIDGAETVALASARNAEAWAVGKREGQDVQEGDPTYCNNARHYAQQSGGSATAAVICKEDAEAWAVGKRNGQAVESTDPTYQNNAKYWSDHAFSGTPEGYEAVALDVADTKVKLNGCSTTLNIAFDQGNQERYDFTALKGQTIRVAITEWTDSNKYMAIAFNIAGSTSDKQATFHSDMETFTLVAENDYVKIVVWSSYAATMKIEVEAIGFASRLEKAETELETISGRIDDMADDNGTSLVIDEAFARSALKKYPFAVAAGTPVRLVFGSRAESNKYMAVSFRTSMNSGTDCQQIFPDCPGVYDIIAENDYGAFVVWTQAASERIQITVTDTARDIAYAAQKTNIRRIEGIVSPVATSAAFSADRVVSLPITIYSGQKVNVLISDHQSSSSHQAIIALGYSDSPNERRQQLTATGPGAYQITAAANYDCVYVTASDETTTSIRATAWIEGTISKPRTFSVLGDSYSTFEGYNPAGNVTWYPGEAITAGNDCQSVEKCWWFRFASEYGCAIQSNESWSGTPVCNDGYGSGDHDATERSFITRMTRLSQSELIFVLGGLNDYWAGAQLGDYVYSGWTDAQKSKFRPAMAYMLDWLQHHHAGAKIIFIKPNQLSTDFKTSVDTVCEHYGVPVVTLTNAVSVVDGHPDTHGMAEVYAQVLDTVVRGI